MHSVKIDSILRAAVGLLLVAFVYVIFVSIHERIVVVGDSAPEFTVTADTGRSVGLPDFGGKLLVLNFWATWCPPCVEETSALSEFTRHFSGKGVVVLGVSVDKDEKQYRAFLQQHRPAFLTARDPAAKINADYGTFKYPETYIIDAKGKVVQKIIGPADWADEKMISYVDSLL
jgi:cytochrome c biogenesis protein CcmG, thiol:disulfide interchange protein DsbE